MRAAAAPAAAGSDGRGLVADRAGAALIAGLWFHRRSPRTDLARAEYVL